MSYSRIFLIQWLIFLSIIIYLFKSMGFFELDRLYVGSKNLLVFAQDLFPPDLTVTWTLIGAIFETIQMAFIGTIIGFMGALPLGLLGARNIAGGAISAITRFFMGIIRTIPALLWAIIFVIAFGLGPLAGTLGLAIYSVAGGIGFYMINYIQLFQYQRLTTALLLTLVVVLTIDLITTRIRTRFLNH